MIARLRGEVLERGVFAGAATVVVDVAGVGYEVIVTAALMAECEPGARVDLHVHHHIREDDQTLFGFDSADERRTFRTLLSAHGVGPTLALAICATHRPVALADIVATNDHAALTMVPGVGKKTAERLMIELRNKLSVPVLASEASGPGSTGSMSALTEVREALSGLGYGPEEIREALGGLDSNVDSSQLLRDALRVLGARRA